MLTLEQVENLTKRACDKLGTKYRDAIALQTWYFLSATKKNHGKKFIVGKGCIGFIEANGMINHRQVTFMMFPEVTTEVMRSLYPSLEVQSDDVWGKAFNQIAV